MVVTFAFGILGAAVFAEPSVAEIEKVIGLIHWNWGRGVWGQAPKKLVCSRPPTPKSRRPSGSAPEDSAPGFGSLGQTYWHGHSLSVAHDLDANHISNFVLV